MHDTVDPRRLPAWQIQRLLKRHGVKQSDVARAARTSQAMVSNVIHRAATASETTERVWSALDMMLNRKGAA